MQPNGEWLINDTPRAKADHSLCQAIISNADACASCSLNPGPKPDVSPFLYHVSNLSELIAAGAQFDYGALALIEWDALKLLKRKQREKEVKLLKEQQAKH